MNLIERGAGWNRYHQKARTAFQYFGLRNQIPLVSLMDETERVWHFMLVRNHYRIAGLMMVVPHEHRCDHGCETCADKFKLTRPSRCVFPTGHADGRRSRCPGVCRCIYHQNRDFGQKFHNDGMAREYGERGFSEEFGQVIGAINKWFRRYTDQDLDCFNYSYNRRLRSFVDNLQDMARRSLARTTRTVVAPLTSMIMRRQPTSLSVNTSRYSSGVCQHSCN